MTSGDGCDANCTAAKSALRNRKNAYGWTPLLIAEGFRPIIVRECVGDRVAGFAAWLRHEDELYDGSVIHIHAIAIG